MQAKVSSYVSSKRKPEEKKTPPEMKNIKVPIPTFPPTAMVYSVPKSDQSLEEKGPDCSQQADIVSAAIMAKVLEERERERSCTKHCDTCTCSRTLKIIHETTHHSIGTQTNPEGSIKNVPTSLVDNVLLQAIKQPQIVKVETADLIVLDSAERVGTVRNSRSNSSAKSDSSNKREVNGNCKSDSTYQLSNTSSPDNSKNTFNSLHHHLCDRSSSTFQLDNKLESANNNSSDSLKGPRYCSVRMQSGSKNILLDNVHNNVAPILYTHPSEKKHESDSITQVKTKGSSTESCSSDDRKSVNVIENHQRVAEWVQNSHNSVDNDTCSSENSRSDSSKKCECCHVDPARYAEMESNVKKFLFGDVQDEFLKRVVAGKQNLEHGGSNEAIEKNRDGLVTRRGSSHTETDI